ncbi:MAG: tryptophan--tRNA ligase [Candidatus Micrarchaeota archaeon]
MVNFIVNPWEVTGDIDYDYLMKQFGITPLQELQLPSVFKDNFLFRRGIVYGHRDFDKFLTALKEKKKLVMMTGLMPSGKFHIGHALLVEQMKFYQSLGAKLYIAVADVEAYNTRNADLSELRRVAIEEYLVNYVALGLDLKKCDVYFQSQRSSEGKKSNAYYSLASFASRHVTFNEVKAIYGDITPAKLSSSLLQTADMLHPQLPEFEGPVNVVVPAGSDQDPHIKLCRDIAQRLKLFNLLPLSSTYHVFLPGLKGGKMSSSDPSSHIALTETPQEAATKIRKYAFSGGQATLEEHRKKGGNPDIDISFQYLRMYFEHDDKKLRKIYDDYKSGALLTGELKQIAIDKVSLFLAQHAKNREKARKTIDKMFA